MKLSKNLGSWSYVAVHLYHPSTYHPIGWDGDKVLLPWMWMLPQQRLRNSTPRLIVSVSQAFALQRAAAKRYRKYYDYHKNRSPNAYLGVQYFLDGLSAIEPGAIFWCKSPVIGHKKVSRPRPENVFDYPSCVNTPGIVGSVTAAGAYIHYLTEVRTRILCIIPKTYVERSKR